MNEKIDSQLEQRVFDIGKQIFTKSQDSTMGLFNKAFWSGKMMDWSMNYPAFKLEMFRFVDVLPSLNTSDQLVEHVREYFLREGLDFPSVIKAGLGAASWTSLTAKMAAATIRKNVEAMANIFITGTNSDSAHQNLEKLWKSGFCFTVDILGEAAVSELEAEDYQKRYLELIEGLAVRVKDWKSQDVLESSPTGAIPRANVSVKCSSLYSQMDPLAMRKTVDTVKDRLRILLRSAKERNVFVNLDMEQYDYKEILLSVAEEIFLEPEFVDYPHFGVVIQAYLKSAYADLTRMIELSSKRKAPLTVRLVKGAYWDFEVIQANQKNWPIPVYIDKAETDWNYERCAELLLKSWPKIVAAFGSHNVRSLAHAMAYAEKIGLAKTAFEVQMLYGMAEPFKKAVQSMGYRVREYAPVGEILPGMAYLVRRLLENTSNESFLRAKFTGTMSAEKLLAHPSTHIKNERKLERQGFWNEAPRDFTLESNRSAIKQAVQKVRQQFPIQSEVVIAGQPQKAAKYSTVMNPCNKTEALAKFAHATEDHAARAVDAAEQALKTWGMRPVSERSAILKKAAQLMRDQKDELTALMVLEVSKNYKEADADVGEAIDFCEYYADEMLRLSSGNFALSALGEANTYQYTPRGVTVAIAPWNFPLAILCGMTVAPLVAGNSVVMKPAEQSTAIAWKLFQILNLAGVPSDALHFLPGLGEEVGAALVKHPRVHIINFTGSREVGLWILENAARLSPGQKHIKKVVAEMGGKNAVIVDDDADLDEAVIGCLQSAFGFQGQKCSALSRVIIHEAAYDKFKNRMVEAIQSMKIGPAEETWAKVSSVIDESSQQRLLSVIEKFQDKIVAQLKVPEEYQNKGHYVPPTLFESADPKSDLGQKEFFGPLLTLFKVKDFDEAIQVFNDVEYALTGGIFSRAPSHLERARREMECGNLYINRGITGANVARQPFGGFKLSGVGAKAGGKDYLLQFLEPKTTTENTMRRGFAPEI